MLFKNRWKKKKILGASAVLLSLTLAGTPLSAAAKVEDDAIYTEEGFEDYAAELSRNKAQAIQTNLDPEWPQGPAVGAAGAVVMDADSGAVLYGKNMNRHLYPASITKLMTALLAYENLDPEDTVVFSDHAVFGIERGSSNIGMDTGESITVEEALYGLMIASANEVSVALGERISGTESKFVALMNERAAELGCKNTNFVTTNGLHDSNHYTSAYDMALIAREIYRHPDLIKYMSQMNYHYEASENQPDDFWILNTNDFLTGEISCKDIVGGKTGYTDEARQTLVSFAERDGKRLICVIMREELPHQYYDTIDLLNYAFDNFKKVIISQEEDRFTLKSADFLSSGPDIFGDSTPSFSIGEDASLMIPKKVSFSDLSAEILPVIYETDTQEEDGTESTDSEKDPEKEEYSETEKSSETEKNSETEASSEASVGNTADAQSAKEQTSDQAGVSSTGKENAQAAEAESPSGQILSAPAPQDGKSRVIGTIQYKFHDYNLGSANVLFLKSSSVSADSGDAGSGTGATAASADLVSSGKDAASSGNASAPESIHGIRALVFGLVHTGAHGSVYLNILLLIPLLLAVILLLCIMLFIYDFHAQRSTRRRKQRRRAQRARRQKTGSGTDRYHSGQTTRSSGEENRVRRNTGSRSVRAGRTDTDRRTGAAGRGMNAGRNAFGNRTSRNRSSRGKYNRYKKES